MEALRIGGLVALILWSAVFLLVGEGLGQTAGPTTHTIFMTALEIKGGTTTEKLAPPTVNPKDLSKGYEFKAPGEADKADPKRWEVSSYRFDPSFVTVRQGDRVNLTVFVVNGDEHESWITDPDGREIVPKRIWNRGREYQVSFVADKVGSYQLTCSSHAPTMAATFLVLPR
ncbi:MAG TPA: cupredoxin domain-containing protein [Candidatus Acidoferrales bacterium]|nr:cupredoxin domain-containing protein [Candidatus Acidoferrales bacterium]